jgi:hypothetical protein
MIGVTAFELGNAAVTLLILRATDLLGPAAAPPQPPSSHSCCTCCTTWPPP